MDFSKTLAALDFQPDGVTCETRRMKWVTQDSPLPDNLRLAEADPRGCHNTTKNMFYLRLCPCWNDPRTFAAKGGDFREMLYAGGLLVNKVMLCTAHEQYFTDYLNYPFLCPGCGIYFDGIDEVLLGRETI